MKETFQNLVAYLKNPVLKEDTNKNVTYRFKIFFQILIICFVTGIIISPIFVLFEEIKWINMDTHVMKDLSKSMSKLQLAFFVVILAPVFEELLFRGSLTLFKKPKSFKIAFYIFTLIFGLIHISNFEITTNVLLLSPILVLPQILLGGYLGFIRVKFGLQWSMLLHATYNGILLYLSFIPDLK